MYLYLFFGNSSTGQTHRQIFMLLMAQTMQTLAWVCPLGFYNTAPHFGVKSLQIPIFWGREFSSQAGKILKVSHYQNNCINLNQILHND